MIFKPSGEIEDIKIYTDPNTGKCRGFAFVQFKTRMAARKAVRSMQGFKING